MAQPTTYEQFMLELLNSYRANPSQAAIDLIPGGNLDEGPPYTTLLPATPRQPLAFNLLVNDAAANQTSWVLANDMANYGSGIHNRELLDGSTTDLDTPSERMAAVGYGGGSPFSAGENIARAWRNSPFDMAEQAQALNKTLFIDANVAGRGHRVNMMNGNFKEVGLSLLSGGPIVQNGDAFQHSVVVTQKFGTVNGSGSFLTGVVFRDANDDDFYSPGEGIGELDIRVTNTQGFDQTIQTMAAGGYQIELAPGNYTVEFRKNGSVVKTETVTIGSENVKVDYFEEVGTPPAPGQGKIVGNKFDDANNNGVLDAGEVGVAGWTIYLDANGNRQLDSGEVSTLTDANGEYIFNDLDPGAYNVAEVLQSGWTQTSPDPINPIGLEFYRLDDQEANGVTGFSGGGDPTFSGDRMIFNAFTAQSGAETINSITVGLSSVGNPISVFLYQDADNDNQPDGNEKLIETAISPTGTSGFVNIPIAPTTVSGTFFVGALYRGDGTNTTWLLRDNDNPAGKSWKAASAAGGFNPNSFSVLAEDSNNWLLRANAAGVLSQIVTVGADETVANVNFLSYECFLTGTQILTSRGEIAVENLRIGDRIQTAEGKIERIKWIGYQTFHKGNVAHPFRTFPIQIKAGALGDNLPIRPLYVSPDHALLVDGLLVNAGALENGSSIIATQPTESFTYYHIELEQHSLLIAEGTYAESFLPQNQARDSFDNGDEYEALYPNHNILSLLPMSFPRVSSKRQLPRCVAKRLADIAESLPGCSKAVAA